MPVSTIQWRAEIGTYYNSCYNYYYLNKIRNTNPLFKENFCSIFIFALCLIISILLKYIFTLRFQRSRLINLYHYIATINFFTMLFYHLLLYRHGDIEKNPGFSSKKSNFLRIYHWNLKSLSSNNFSKVS